MSKIDFVKSGKLKYIILSVIAVLLIAAILLTAFIVDGYHKVDSEDIGVLAYGDKEYVLRGGVESFLIMGIDKTDEDITNDSYNNDQQTDFLMLIVFDHIKKTYSTVHINRDTMADVDIYGLTGKKIGTEKMQIALAHTYGDGKTFSDYNTAKSVSRLFYGARVNHTISFTLDSVAEMNNLVGGVELEVLDDFTQLDGGERLVKGDTVTLTDKEALLYVRSRAGLDDDTNINRMKRQKQYIEALRLEFEKRMKEGVDNEFLHDVVDKMSEHTNADIQDLFDVNNNMQNYKFVETDSIAGESKLNEETKRMEFLPDEDSIAELAIALFYTSKD